MALKPDHFECEIASQLFTSQRIFQMLLGKFNWEKIHYNVCIVVGQVSSFLFHRFFFIFVTHTLSTTLSMATSLSLRIIRPLYDAIKAIRPNVKSHTYTWSQCHKQNLDEHIYAALI